MSPLASSSKEVSRVEGKGDLKIPLKGNDFSKQIPVHLLNFLKFLFLAHCVGVHVFGLQNMPLETVFLLWAMGIHLCPGPWPVVLAYHTGLVLG